MKTIIAGLLLAFNAQQVVAQDTSLSAGREAAARELVEIMDMERQMMGGATAMMDALVLQSPELNAYRDVILDWAQSVLSWEVFGPKYVAYIRRVVYGARTAGTYCVLSYSDGPEGPHPIAGTY